MQKYKNIIIIIATIVIIILVRFTGIYNAVLKQFYPKKYSEYVEKYSAEYNVDPLLVYSIIKAESNFKKDAISSSGAKGLMQLMNSTATEIANEINEEYSEGDLQDIEKNIMLGTKYYSDLEQKYSGNMLLALAAYNAGIGNVTQWIAADIIKEDGSDIENIPFKETNMYVRKIVNNYKMYQKLYR